MCSHVSHPRAHAHPLIIIFHFRTLILQCVCLGNHDVTIYLNLTRYIIFESLSYMRALSQLTNTRKTLKYMCSHLSYPRAHAHPLVLIFHFYALIVHCISLGNHDVKMTRAHTHPLIFIFVFELFPYIVFLSVTMT